MKIYNSPYFDHSDGLDIMIMDDPSEDGREIYYRMPGYPYVFAFGLSNDVSMFTTVQYAKANANICGGAFQLTAFDFYKDRLSACPSYGFVSGHEILKIVTRCAFWDSTLTDRQFSIIINLAEQAHIRMMEDNYNAGWQDE